MEVPPHIFALSDNAYQFMLTGMFAARTTIQLNDLIHFFHHVSLLCPQIVKISQFSSRKCSRDFAYLFANFCTLSCERLVIKIIDQSDFSDQNERLIKNVFVSRILLVSS